MNELVIKQPQVNPFNGKIRRMPRAPIFTRYQAMVMGGLFGGLVFLFDVNLILAAVLAGVVGFVSMQTVGEEILLLHAFYHVRFLLRVNLRPQPIDDAAWQTLARRYAVADRPTNYAWFDGDNAVFF